MDLILLVKIFMSIKSRECSYKSKDSIKCYSYTYFFVCNFSITNGSKSSKLILFLGVWIIVFIL